MRQLIAVQETPKQTQQPPQDAFGGMSLLFLMMAIFGVAYILLIRPMKQKEKRDRDSLLTNLKKNDEVMTAAGIIGVVANIKDEEVVLKLDESSNARLRVLKNTIIRVLNPKEPAKDAQAAEGAKPGNSPAK